VGKVMFFSFSRASALFAACAQAVPETATRTAITMKIDLILVMFFPLLSEDQKTYGS
jgi:hypothetical protein